MAYAPAWPSGINSPFGELSPAWRKVTNVLLTRLPLVTTQSIEHFLLLHSFCKIESVIGNVFCFAWHVARLACLRHAASVHPELESNSQKRSRPTEAGLDHKRIQFSFDPPGRSLSGRYERWLIWIYVMFWSCPDSVCTESRMLDFTEVKSARNQLRFHKDYRL